MNSICCASVCALFFIPHIVGKFTVPQALQFYRRCRLQAAEILDVSRRRHRDRADHRLLFDLYTAIFGFIAFIHLMVAAAATYKLTKKWIWVIGGIEYCVFWALCCLVVAMHACHTGGLY